MKKTKTTWIVAVGGSTMDGVDIGRVYGTKYAVKKHLLELVKQYRDENAEVCEFATEKLKEIEEIGCELYAYADFYTMHFDFVAIPEPETIQL